MVRVTPEIKEHTSILHPPTSALSSLSVLDPVMCPLGWSPHGTPGLWAVSIHQGSIGSATSTSHLLWNLLNFHYCYFQSKKSFNEQKKKLRSGCHEKHPSGSPKAQGI